MQELETLLRGLRAAAEPTRLRLIALCREGELTVSELVRILGQSQPRVSRHLKLLCEAGLLERFREGIHAFYRLADTGDGAGLARTLAESIPDGDQQLVLDQERLTAIPRSRAAEARTYFRRNAAEWDRIRALHIDEESVERALLTLVPEGEIGAMLDIGTGTGRILELLAPRAGRAVGLDFSPEMLAIARARVDADGLRHCQIRKGDMYQLPWPDGAFDLASLHQVLHHAEKPATVIREAARVLHPAGRLLVVDFAPHELEALRETHAHRRLGFPDAEVAGWFRQAGLVPGPVRHLPGGTLTVVIWTADKPADAEAGAAA